MANRHMAEKSKKSIKNLLNNNNFLILVSLIAAIIFWLVLTVSEADSQNTISGINVSIPIENSVVGDMGLDVIGNKDGYKASVTVKGPAYVVGSLTPDDIAVTASISNVTTSGNYELELRATKQAGSVNNEFEIASISPSNIIVSFDFIDTKVFTVTAQAIGASAVEGLVAENPVIIDNASANLTFKGTRGNMEKIARVVAVADVNEVLDKTKSYTAFLKAYDSEDKELSLANYTITTADGLAVEGVEISVPISKTKTVPVKARFVNVPNVYQNKPISYSLSESKLDIIGPPETIENITDVSLGEIDFDQITDDNQVFRVPVVLPEGVKSADNIETVTVTINGLDNFAVRTFTISNVKVSFDNGISNETGVASASLSRSIKNVKIYGPKSVVDKLSSDNLYAYVNIGGLKAGEHKVTARIKCSSSDEVWQVGSYTATINVK